MQLAISSSTSTTPRRAWPASTPGAEPLEAAGSVMKVREGEEICAEGGDADHFYKILSGVVRVCKFLSDGRRQIEAFHRAGDVFGFEMGHERQLNAEAITDCVIVCYRRRNVEQMAQGDGAVTRALFGYVMQNLAHAQSHSLLLGRRGATEKVANFLLAWAARSKAGGVVTLEMTRQDIADYLGLTIETVSRSLSQLERDGVIALPGIRQVRVLDNEALEDLAA